MYASIQQILFWFFETGLLCNPDWPGIHYMDQDSLRLIDAPTLCTTTPRITERFTEHLLCAGHKVSI